MVDWHIGCRLKSQTGCCAGCKSVTFCQRALDTATNFLAPISQPTQLTSVILQVFAFKLLLVTLEGQQNSFVRPIFILSYEKKGGTLPRDEVQKFFDVYNTLHSIAHQHSAGQLRGLMDLCKETDKATQSNVQQASKTIWGKLRTCRDTSAA